MQHNKMMLERSSTNHEGNIEEIAKKTSMPISTNIASCSCNFRLKRSFKNINNNALKMRTPSQIIA